VKGRVLVVDDDAAVRGLLERVLGDEGFSVESVGGGREALDALSRRSPNLILLDIMLAETDGLDVLAQLRRTSDVPVILLTARGDETDRVLGLKVGADDYVVKPFSPAELTARIDAVLRRSGPRSPTQLLAFDGLSIDLGPREVLVNEAAVELTAREFDLLAFLAGSPRQVFSREQLLQNVWASSGDWQDVATVTEHIRRVRRKIESDPEHPRWVVTVRGVGYRFQP
jgi:two-component system, OmpR family, phosphate regulon response regulator PhoB